MFIRIISFMSAGSLFMLAAFIAVQGGDGVSCFVGALGFAMLGLFSHKLTLQFKDNRSLI